MEPITIIGIVMAVLLFIILSIVINLKHRKWFFIILLCWTALSIHIILFPHIWYKIVLDIGLMRVFDLLLIMIVSLIFFLIIFMLKEIVHSQENERELIQNNTLLKKDIEILKRKITKEKR